MADDSDVAYELHAARAGYARQLLVRAIARPRALLRKLAIGDAIGERPKTGQPRAAQKRR